jgi:hypothetical protein
VTETAPSFLLVRWLFIRLLALVYLVAFASLWVQIHGLVGSNGILPLEELLQRYAESDELVWRRHWLLPTLCWLDTSDNFLNLLCGSGVALSLVLLVGVSQRLVLALLWVGYLSLTTVGQLFLGFQWDALLLEAGFLAIFFAPAGLRPGLHPAAPPSFISRWLLIWLVFRVHFMSGIVKITAGDETWHSLTALNYHYFTTPLPTWIGYYAHHLPDWFHKAGVVMTFVFEIGFPLLIFFGRRFRIAAFVGLIGFQVVISATGNYGFFNILSVALCVPLLHDGFVRRLVPGRWRSRLEVTPSDDRSRYLKAVELGVLVSLTSVVLMLSSFQMIGSFTSYQTLPETSLELLGWTRPTHAVNGYGLFRTMTTERPEIIIEGSADGVSWQAYELPWKVGDVGRRPAFAQPHMPRLDWQMWFAALGDWRQNRNQWFISFLEHLLRGTPEVLDLLEENPFGGAPPRFIRARRFRYEFTQPEQRAQTGNWWQRRDPELYCPVLTLQNGRLTRAGR